ncbi:MAG: hypothetical protein H7Y17_06825 [Chlorobia bacterium]|nr:hypothetical protein [Fimbriimonadaceae bacterium]
MEFLSALWMPILVSAVLVWIASFLCHMVLPHHKSEFKELPDEDKFNVGLEGTPPGLYMFQWCNPAQMNDPDKKARIAKGPNGVLAIWPGPVKMGENLILTLLFYIVVGVFVGYIGWHSIDPGSTYLERFRICGAVAFAAHGLGWMSFFIWFKFGKFWPNLFDSIVYALITAGTFAWLWPKT